MKLSTVVTDLPTRRQLIAGIPFAFGALSAALAPKAWAQKMQETQSAGAEASLTYLHQEVETHAAAQRIYDVLLDSKQFAAFTGMPAEISREAGGAFSMFGGLVTGRNIELLPNQRIVQAWRPGSWDPGIYSLVKFELQTKGSGTTIVLDHTGFPQGTYRHLNAGWYERYWEPLKKFLG